MPLWLPYCGEAPLPTEWLVRWNPDPVLLTALAGLALAAWRYRDRVRAGYAAAALGVAVFLFVSPFCALGSALFTVRILHDVALAAVLAPLLVAALRLHRTDLPGSPALWTALHAMIFWLWHAPPLYAAAMSSDLAFWVMQVTIAGSAAVWWAKVVPAEAPAAAAMLLATMVSMGALGALLTFAPRAFYEPHWISARAWGLSALEDQQIAGIVMWAPASLVYLLVALAILYRALGGEKRAA